MQNTKTFAKFIDKLRASRNIHREDFVRDIISLRQYYRFVSGESSLKNESIMGLLNRLEINFTDAYRRFINEENDNVKKLNNVYDLIAEFEYEKAKAVFSTIDYDSFSTTDHMKFYSITETLLLYNLKAIQKTQFNDRLIELLDYPNILKRDILTFYEITGLASIIDYVLEEHGDLRLANFIYNVLQEPSKLHVTSTHKHLPILCAITSRIFGRKGEYIKSIELAIQGINICKKNGPTRTLLNLYCYKALAELNLNRNHDMKATLVKLFSLLKVVDNKNIDKNYRLIVRDLFNIVESDLIIYKAIKK